VAGGEGHKRGWSAETAKREDSVDLCTLGADAKDVKRDGNQGAGHPEAESPDCAA
jgi:hypothetical protein